MAVILATLTVAAFAAGWYLSELQHDSTELSVTRAAYQAAEKSRVITQETARGSARKLEEKLEQLRLNRQQYQRVIHQEISQPVFTQRCATDDYVRLFNEGSDAAERALSGKPVN